MENVITRHRHELKRRTLTVQATERLTPHMIRVTLGGEELEGFTSLGADDHIKLFFPGAEADKPEMRDYTPRRHDAKAGTLVLDFATHDAGPATAWAEAAVPGDTLRIGGPRGSAVIAPVFDWYLLIGDETALPAIGRRVEELPAGVTAITLAAVPGPEDEQRFESAAAQEAHWLHRPVAEAHEPEALLEAARGLALPEGRGFVWIAAEARVARALKLHFLDERGHPAPWLKAAGYWVKGDAGSSDKALD
ncbi:siderophore-interacting protein [Salipiger sp. H15]|uniref:Siderophore-interacting protein n=1 Tax=Alloyangia sp. H15 TaxID=3029062 RepID=A0AAU8AEB4_9RHOB